MCAPLVNVDPQLCDLLAAMFRDIFGISTQNGVLLRAEILSVSASALELAEVYQQRQILTAKFYNDGLHIAMATIADVDLLVSWNFKHIVHYDKIRRFNAINLERGYKPIQIFSPREVISYDNEA
jgi:hypothetical protein